MVSDVSYFQTIELKGRFETLAALLALIVDAAAVSPSSPRYASGVRECQIGVHECAAWPYGYIGPASILWDVPIHHSNNQAPPSSTSDPPLRQVFLRFHPSILTAVTGAVEAAIKDIQANWPGAMPYTSNTHSTDDILSLKSIGKYHRSFTAFEIMGPFSTDTLKACFRPVASTEQEKMQVGRLFLPGSCVFEG